MSNKAILDHHCLAMLVENRMEVFVHMKMQIANKSTPQSIELVCCGESLRIVCIHSGTAESYTMVHAM